MRKREAVGEGGVEMEDPENDILELPEGITDEIMEAAKDAVDALGSGNGGIPGLLSAYAVNIAVAGECYLMEHEDRWSIRSTQEITVRATDRKAIMRTTRKARRGTLSPAVKDVRATEVELPEGTYIGRIWMPHARYSDEPDSSMIALREPCQELMTLQRMIRSVARSRMNAGLLFIPDGLSAAARTPGAEEQEADPLEYELMVAMTTPVADEASAANVVPMLVRGPSELGQNIQWISFARDSDSKLVERADRVLERILQGLDVPKDIVTGLANVKYSNAVQIDESLYKSHIEPLALVFVDALTSMYVRPAVKAAVDGIDDKTLAKVCIWYDPTEVVTKPDPAQSANDGFDKFLLSGDAWRRAHGYSESDAPTQDEIANRIAVEKMQIPPEVGIALLHHIIPTVLDKEKMAARDALPVPFPESAKRLLGDPTYDPEKDPTAPPGAKAGMKTPPTTAPSPAQSQAASTSKTSKTPDQAGDSETFSPDKAVTT